IRLLSEATLRRQTALSRSRTTRVAEGEAGCVCDHDRSPSPYQGHPSVGSLPSHPPPETASALPAPHTPATPPSVSSRPSAENQPTPVPTLHAPGRNSAAPHPDRRPARLPIPSPCS